METLQSFFFGVWASMVSTLFLGLWCIPFSLVFPNGIHHSLFCSVTWGSGDRPREQGCHGVVVVYSFFPVFLLPPEENKRLGRKWQNGEFALYLQKQALTSSEPKNEENSTPNMTGRRFHRTMETVPRAPGSLKALLFPPPSKQSTKQGDASGRSEVRRGTSSNHFHCPVPQWSLKNDENGKCHC